MNQGYYNGNNNGNYGNGYNNGYYNGYNNSYYNGNGNRGFIPNYNNNGMNNNNNNDDKTSLLPLIIVIVILGIVVALLIVLLLTPPKDKNTEKTETENTENTNVNKSDILIGDQNFGYMKIPYDYVKDNSSPSPNVLKYYSKDKKYSIKMTYVEDNGKGAYNYSRAYAETLKDAGATDLKQAQVTIAGKEAYQIYAVTAEDNTVLTLCIQTTSYIRFVVIEGPDGSNIVYKSLESYTF